MESSNKRCGVVVDGTGGTGMRFPVAPAASGFSGACLPGMCPGRGQALVAQGGVNATRPDGLEGRVDGADGIGGRAACALGDAAARPVQSFVRHFRGGSAAKINAASHRVGHAR